MARWGINPIFRRFYDLCLNKDASMVDMRRLGWGFGGNVWV
jgi:hypothetical protein